MGFGRTVVVLAGRIGCRSRQAAFGPSRPRAKSSRTTTSGLATSRESSKWRTSAGSRIVGGKAARSVAGPQKTQEHAKAILPEALCRWKTLWAGKAAVVDATAVAAVLAPRKAWVSRWSGARQGASEVRSSAPHAVENTAAGRRRLRADARFFPPTRREVAVAIGPKLESRAVKRGPSRGWIVERRFGAALVR